MANEEWKPIKDADHLFVSNYGRVMNSKTGKMLTPRQTYTGYLRIHMPMKNGKRKDAYIHRLVAEAFCFHPKGCDIVNHIDFDNTNNHAENIEWTTQYNNILYSMDNGRYPTKQKPIMVIGEKDGIKCFYHSYHDASRAIGCDEKTIIRSCKTGKRTKDNFLWKKVI